MFLFANFSWLLKFIYIVSRCSGFIYTNIDFSLQKVVIRKSYTNMIMIALSIAFSCIACSFDPHFPIAEVTHSKLLEAGFNFSAKLWIWFALFMKAANFFHSTKFFEIMRIMQWSDMKVHKEY